MKIKSIMLITVTMIFLLASCGEKENVNSEIQPEVVVKEDVVKTDEINKTLDEELLKQYIAKRYGKEVDKINEVDYARLREEEYIELDNSFVNLIYNLNTTAPKVIFLKIYKDNGVLTEEETKVFNELLYLQAVDIYCAEGFEDVNFANGLNYAQLRVDFETSSLPKESINHANTLDGDIVTYARYKKDGMVYEHLDSNVLYSVDGEDFVKSKLFVSKEEDSKENLLQTFDTKRLQFNDETLFLKDVNFDGHDDVIVEIGNFGGKGFERYSGYLYNQGQYEINESFLEYQNLALDSENKRLISSANGSSNTETWYEVEYLNGNFETTGGVSLSYYYEDGKTKVTIDYEESFLVDDIDDLNINYLSYGNLEHFDVDEDFVKDQYGPREFTVKEKSFDDISFVNEYPRISVSIEVEENVKRYLPKTAFENQDIIPDNITTYNKYEKDNILFEEFVTDELIDNDEGYGYKSKIIVSKINDDKRELLQVFDSLVFRIRDSSEDNIEVLDVNFDGEEDFLTYYGLVGNQVANAYNCYIYENGEYVYHKEFYNIFNPSIDKENKRIYSNSRGSSNTRYYTIFKYIDKKFVATDELICEIVGDDKAIYTETRDLLTNPVKKVCSYEDYSWEEWSGMFYSGGYWHLDNYNGDLE